MAAIVKVILLSNLGEKSFDFGNMRQGQEYAGNCLMKKYNF